MWYITMRDTLFIHMTHFTYRLLISFIMLLLLLLCIIQYNELGRNPCLFHHFTHVYPQPQLFIFNYSVLNVPQFQKQFQVND